MSFYTIEDVAVELTQHMVWGWNVGSRLKDRYDLRLVREERQTALEQLLEDNKEPAKEHLRILLMDAQSVNGAEWRPTPEQLAHKVTLKDVICVPNGDWSTEERRAKKEIIRLRQLLAALD